MLVRKKVERLLTKGEVKELMEAVSPIAPKIRNRVVQHCANAYTSEQVGTIKKELDKFGLKEFEVVNLIDTKPTGLVHLQNIIEELTERFTEEQMLEILDIFTKQC